MTKSEASLAAGRTVGISEAAMEVRLEKSQSLSLLLVLLSDSHRGSRLQ